jgi:hypothetical protein
MAENGRKLQRKFSKQEGATLPSVAPPPLNINLKNSFYFNEKYSYVNRTSS